MGGESTVQVTVGPTAFRVENPTADVDDFLHEELAYTDPDARHIDSVRNGTWDGIHRLYDRTDHSAAVGLLDRARSALESDGYDVRVTDEREGDGDPISTTWGFPHPLREYQQEAVTSVLGSGGGVVSLPTGAGKTVVALRCIHAVGRRTVIFVHTKELLRQWFGQVRDVLDVEPGRIGDGEWSEGPVTVALMDTLVSRGPDNLDGYDVAIYDECHRTSAADTFHDVGQAVNAPLRVGLSATPWRRVSGEELKIEGATGGIAYQATAEELIEAGHLARPEWHVVDPAEHGEQRTANPSEGYQTAYKRCIVECDARNRAVAGTSADLARDGHSVLVSVDRLSHGEALTDRLTDAHGVDATFLCGSDGSDRRESVLDAFGPGDVLVSTLIREGVDLPDLNAIVLAGGGRSKRNLIQQIGRALRPSGGDTAVVVDVRDRGKHLGEHYETRRETCRDYYGRFGPDANRDPDVEMVREWLARSGVPTDKLDVCRGTDGGVRVEVTGWIDEFDHYRSLMREAGARYDGEANYIRATERLPEVADS